MKATYEIKSMAALFPMVLQRCCNGIEILLQRKMVRNRRKPVSRSFFEKITLNQFLLLVLLFLGFGSFFEGFVRGGDGGGTFDAFAFHQFFHGA